MGKIKAIVYHDYYGCDTGCCGHLIEVKSPDKHMFRHFNFTHPEENEDLIEWAKNLLIEEFGEEHCYDLDWKNCAIIDYENCPSWC